jgi:kinesin family member C2/C3
VVALEGQLAMLKASSSSHNGELQELREENEAMKRKMREAKSSVSGVQAELDRERDICLALTNEFKLLEDEVKTLRKRIVKLNDMIVELKGSIMVFCRVRPVGRHEIEDLQVTQADIDRLVRYPDYNLIDFKQTDFEYDRVFTPASTQESIYDEVEPFVRSAMGGYRVCIFA